MAAKGNKKDTIDEITPITTLIGMINAASGASHKQLSAAKSTATRIPITTLSSIEAFAKHTNTSRSKIIVILLASAIEEVYEGLDEDMRRKVDSLRMERLDALVKETCGKGNTGELFDSEEAEK